MEDIPESVRPTFRGLFTTSAGLLAAALLVVELVAGIQTYVTSTIIPLVAGDLDGQAQYGLAQAANQVGLFLTLPLGAYLASRFGRSNLLLIFTGVAILGASVAAVAPTMGWYVFGRGITGLASGALATIAMDVVATSLPKEWRRLGLRVADLVEILSRLWTCDGGQFDRRPSGLRARCTAGSIPHGKFQGCRRLLLTDCG